MAEETKDKAAEEKAEETAAAPEEETAENTAETPEEPAEEKPEAGGAAEEAPGQEEKKGGFLNRKKKKDKKDEQIEDLNDRLKRQLAEFENFRRRSEKEKAAMFETGARNVIEKLLPVVDNFERGLAGKPEGDAFAEGMDKIYKQLLKVLEDLGVEPIESVGQEFDPNFHNAVMHVEDEEAGDNMIVEELQKGYKYKDTVVRYSMVKVAN